MSGLKPYFALSAQEWGELDATGKETLSELCRETLERWQDYIRSRRELSAGSRDPRRYVSQLNTYRYECRAGVYEHKLQAIVEALHLHEDELYPACRVGLLDLVDLVAKRYGISADEAALTLR